ncbi:hypothetical protein HMPREF1019_01893 [Campylobacter sp. 10_1_50]|uniref:hypothetical protein n=1 Tax=Campylobacter TaxID=194 RepID=UPI0002410503|nr:MULTISPECIES: hypothetical protein [Campylobacter]EHL88010.1 hypothetical protein HMPREF1019_01893 [Campylobacter sp. 10_1_50]
MITSINGLSNTPIQDNTIQKENTIENVAKKGKQDKSVSEEKFDYSKYMFRPWTDNVKEFIDIDQSKEDWITKTIDKIDSMLSNKYTPEERRALYGKYPETIEKAIDWELQGYMDFLRDNSIDGKPTIEGKMIGLGIKEEEADLRAFMDSMSSLYPNNNKESLSLLSRTDLSIDEFKTLFAKAREKATKDVEEQRKQIIKEEQEYNANFAKEQSEKKFKPMQVKKKYETYDINKDQRFLYARELLNFKEKRGIDVLELMQKIDKKQILNKMA